MCSEVAVRVTKIVTHRAPHFDEILAIWLLRRFGQVKFPGIEVVPVETWSEMPGGETWRSLFDKQGILTVGIGCGPYDEHPVAGQPRVADHCAATLVAYDLGISERKDLVKLLEYAVKEDTQGSSTEFEIAPLIKLLHRVEDDSAVLELASRFIEAIYRKQSDFWSTLERLDQIVTVVSVNRGERSFKIALAKIGSEEARAAAFYRGARVFIQVQDSGNVQIFANKKFGVDLEPVAVAIRRAERAKNGITGEADLCGEGCSVPGAECWYYFPPTSALLNGSLTAKKPPTKLSPDEVLEIVKMSVGKK